MEKLVNMDFLLATIKRAGYTMAQTAIGMITVGATLNEVNWVNVFSVSAVAGIVSVLKSFVVGVPEVSKATEVVE